MGVLDMAFTAPPVGLGLHRVQANVIPTNMECSCGGEGGISDGRPGEELSEDRRRVARSCFLWKAERGTSDQVSVVMKIFPWREMEFSSSGDLIGFNRQPIQRNWLSRLELQQSLRRYHRTIASGGAGGRVVLDDEFRWRR